MCPAARTQSGDRDDCRVVHICSDRCRYAARRSSAKSTARDGQSISSHGDIEWPELVALGIGGRKGVWLSRNDLHLQSLVINYTVYTELKSF